MLLPNIQASVGGHASNIDSYSKRVIIPKELMINLYSKFILPLKVKSNISRIDVFLLTVTTLAMNKSN